MKCATFVLFAEPRNHGGVLSPLDMAGVECRAGGCTKGYVTVRLPGHIQNEAQGFNVKHAQLAGTMMKETNGASLIPMR